MIDLFSSALIYFRTIFFFFDIACSIALVFMTVQLYLHHFYFANLSLIFLLLFIFQVRQCTHNMWCLTLNQFTCYLSS